MVGEDMKKGFTLVELLGVIVILGVIGAIVTPVIQNSLKESAKDACMRQVDSFKKAARNYFNQNPFALDDDSYTVSLRTLQNNGFLKEGDIKNPVTGGNFNLNNVVTIYKGSSVEYRYSYNDCG